MQSSRRIIITPALVCFCDRSHGGAEEQERSGLQHIHVPSASATPMFMSASHVHQHPGGVWHNLTSAMQ